MRAGPTKRAWIAVACCVAGLVGVSALATCSYPDFQYGTGGSGGSGTEPPPTPQVTCGESGTLCEPGAVCCFHDSDPAMDHCGPATTCGPSFAEFSCNTSADCSGGICCLQDLDNDSILDVISCKATCAAMSEAPMCTVDGDCTSGVCVNLTPPPAKPYPGYNLCAP